MNRKNAAGVFAGLLVGLWGLTAQATTFTVTNLADDGTPGTLRYLLKFVNDGDTVVIPAGKIELSSGDGSAFDASGIDADKMPDLDVTKSITIQGAGLLRTIIVGKSNNDRVFDIHSPAGANIAVTIEGMTIQNANISGNGGGIRVMGAAGVMVRDAAVVGNSAAAGGGVYHSGTGSVTLQNTILAANPVNNCAGAFIDDGGNTDTDHTCFVGETIICGDGIIGAGEECDDGNDVEGDGCSSLCERESGGGTTGGKTGGLMVGQIHQLPIAQSTPLSVCGDGVKQSGEECDDGNVDDHDLCTHDCKNALCGDHITQSVLGEQCDDGNTVSGDGCSAICHPEKAPPPYKPWYRRLQFWR